MLGFKLGLNQQVFLSTESSLQPAPGLSNRAILSPWILFFHSVRPGDQLGHFLCNLVQNFIPPLLQETGYAVHHLSFVYILGAQRGNEIHLKTWESLKIREREFNTAFCCLLGRAVERYPDSETAAQKKLHHFKMQLPGPCHQCKLRLWSISGSGHLCAHLGSGTK